MDILSDLGIIIIMEIAAVLAGMYADLGCDLTAAGNLNSRLLQAAKEGNVHKIFDCAVTSVPLLVGAMTIISGAVSHVLLMLNQPVLVVILAAPAIAAAILVVISATSYMGNMTSLALYNQPLYVDVLYENIPAVAAYAFIYLSAVNFISYLIIYHLVPGIPLSMPVLEFLIGVTLGCVISVVGGIHSGAEVLCRHNSHTAGVSDKTGEDIMTRESPCLRNSIDIVYFCSRFSAPMTGLCFGLVIFLIYLIFAVFGSVNGIIAGFIIIVCLFILNYWRC